MIRCIVNDKYVETDLHPAEVTLDFIRNHLKLTGTKEGCREGECGACTVLVGELNDSGGMEYKSCASCLLPIGDINHKHVVTIEGVNLEKLNRIQQFIYDNDASQCGFCTPGIVLSLTGFCLTSKELSFEDAQTALDGNICRCTGYVSIQNAARQLSGYLCSKTDIKQNRIKALVKHEILPEYFLRIDDRLKEIKDIPRGINISQSRFEDLNQSIAVEIRKPDRCQYNVEPELSPGSDEVLIAGGTDLFVQKPDKLLDSKLSFLSNRGDLKNIVVSNNMLRIGGGVTVEQFRTSDVISKYFPSMEKDLLLVSSMIMRNKATIAGNFVNASPIGDLTIIFLVLNAVLIIENKSGHREVKLKDFYRGYKKLDLESDEIITEIQIPFPLSNTCYNFEKVSSRKQLDIASTNSAMAAIIENNTIKEVRISAGGVAPVPLLLKETSRYLINKQITPDVISEAGVIASEEVTPIDDIRGKAEYKKLLLRQLIYAHFIKLFPELIKLEEVVK